MRSSRLGGILKSNRSSQHHPPAASSPEPPSSSSASSAVHPEPSSSSLQPQPHGQRFQVVPDDQHAPSAVHQSAAAPSPQPPHHQPHQPAPPAQQHPSQQQQQQQQQLLLQQSSSSSPPPQYPLARSANSVRHASTLSLERPPVNAVAQDPPSAVDRPPAEHRYTYTGPPLSQNTAYQLQKQQQKPQQQQASPETSKKSSLRSKLFGHKSDKADKSESSTRGLGRRVSVRKSDVPPRYQAPPAADDQHLHHQHQHQHALHPGQSPPQQQQWPPSQGSSPQLPASTEEDESNLDPYLQRDDPDSTTEDLYGHPYPLEHQHSHQQHHHQPALVRINTDQSYHNQQPGLENYSPDQYSQQHQPPPSQQQQQQQQAGGGLPPPYQAYAQSEAHPHPQQQQQQQHSAPYQAFHPPGTYSQQSLENAPHLFYQQQQAQGSQQFLPQQQQHHHQPELHHPQPTAGILQNPDQQHLTIRPPSQQQNFNPPSPIPPPNYQTLDSVQPGGLPLQGVNGQADSDQEGQMPLQRATRPADINRQALQPQSRDSASLQPNQQGQLQPPTPTPAMQAFGTNVVPPSSQGQPYKGPGRPGPAQQDAELGRATPPPRTIHDYTEEELQKLLVDHEVLREKYQKVKRYFFEQQNQVHQLQNTLANQRLSLSRTSLDDSEYFNKFNRLDGNIMQLALAIRKDWKAVPQWLQGSVNRDALQTGKEMIAAGRAFISRWLVDEVFEKYFHPDLDPGLSTQLKQIQHNIRRTAAPSQTPEEEDGLISKITTWRLATLEGLVDQLRTQQAPRNREKLAKDLSEKLIASLGMYLIDPPPPDLRGGVPMIIELAVHIASNLPLESRDVCIEYFLPGTSISLDFMKKESGLPPLIDPMAGPPPGTLNNDLADKISVTSTASDPNKDSGNVSSVEQDQMMNQKDDKSRRMFGFGGSKPKPTSQQQQQQLPQQQGKLGAASAGMGAGGSSVSLSGPPPGSQQGQPGQQQQQQQQQQGQQSSQQGQQQGQLQPPGSSGGMPEEKVPPRVRVAIGVAVHIRGRSVLIKSPVYET